MIRLPNERIEL